MTIAVAIALVAVLASLLLRWFVRRRVHRVGRILAAIERDRERGEPRRRNEDR